MTDSFTIENVSDFSIHQIAESGQTFRWNSDGNGGYTGVAFGKVINIKQSGNSITINGANEAEYQSIWKHYFDMDSNYGRLKDSLRGKDEHLDNAIEFGNGIRILNQDVWEMTISFIISGNNNIPRIKKSIDLICERYGNFIKDIEGKKYYSFPTPKQLSGATVEDLRACGVGYRDSYIFRTTRAVLEKEVDLELVKTMHIDDAREELKKLTGIGDKVADCILLFSCNKKNAFPVDTWVKKILSTYYNFEKTSNKEINRFANEYFGEYCGIAQQYLFYYIRSKI